MYIDTFKHVVPCPQSMAKTEKIVALFSLSTWACMGLVFIFVSILFWILSKYPAQRNAFTGFNLLAQCFSASWAILLGISIPQIPVSLHTRNLFIVYVWYCFAISTVFQAYFTTYLVEPGYGARIKTLEDVMAAGLKLGSYPVMESLQNVIDLPKLSEFQEDVYVDMSECVSSVMFNRKAFTPAISYFPSYLALASGFHDQSKVVCFLDESILTLPMSAGVPMGYPILHILNVHIRRCVEAGLLENYWSEIKHKINLKVKQTDEESEYVVFSLTHLTPVFMLLVFGYVISTILFLCELVRFIAYRRLSV
ncbi:hypothetical protein L9F63_026721 [Diploptera punctata]|uniref:Ionotropic glutamate receptor C-terminal domain-containing protein n=1 Tax=Diploptera punctata TaxID=6984 RepID=A0AAD8AGQ1_DIPPU|nr:hypothetical protein L9F63_026721 [Diploptera punctata]